jgi:hypothetical protein
MSTNDMCFYGFLALLVFCLLVNALNMFHRIVKQRGHTSERGQSQLSPAISDGPIETLNRPEDERTIS